MNVFPVATILLSSLDKAIQEFNGADRSSSKRRLPVSGEADAAGMVTVIDAMNYHLDAFREKITKVLPDRLYMSKWAEMQVDSYL